MSATVIDLAGIRRDRGLSQEARSASGATGKHTEPSPVERFTWRTGDLVWAFSPSQRRPVPGVITAVFPDWQGGKARVMPVYAGNGWVHFYCPFGSLSQRRPGEIVPSDGGAA